MFCFLDVVAAAGEAVSRQSRNGTAATPADPVLASAVTIAAAEAELLKKWYC